MHEVKSLSLLIGTGKCNANCKHCAGKIHRKDAPKYDGVIDEFLVTQTIAKCYNLGARSLSISSSGEPTLSPNSVSRTLEIARGIEAKFENINLYTNGIRIGFDKEFADEYLPFWKQLGLTRVYVTLHSADEEENARAYCVNKYPTLSRIIGSIHDAGLHMRANLLLNKHHFPRSDFFFHCVNYLHNSGVDSISAWPLRGQDDKIDPGLSPLESELDKMEDWASSQQFPVRVLREKHHSIYDTGQKLTLFPDGELRNTWCNY